MKNQSPFDDPFFDNSKKMQKELLKNGKKLMFVTLLSYLLFVLTMFAGIFWLFTLFF